MKRYVVVMLAAACGSTGLAPQPVIGSRPVDGAPVRMTIADGQDMGSFGIAPAGARDESDWIPVGHDTLYLFDGKPANMPKLAIDAKGTLSKIAYVADRDVPYGCDNNKLHATTFTGDPARLEPGLVWMLPVDAPASWQPAARAITTGSVSPKARAYTVGPIVMSLVVTDAKHGEIRFSWDGAALAPAMPIERGDMDGADDTPIDLAAGGVGVPEPIAAWSTAGPQSPHVIAFFAPSYEGVNIRIAIVDATRVRILDDGMYLYRCAF